MLNKTHNWLQTNWINAGIVALFISSIFILAMSFVMPTKADGPTATCPAGSYEIGRKEQGGDPICKLEPTGCPYGDSIPLDSPKCAPPENPEQAYAPWQPEQPATPAPASTPQVKGCSE